MCYEKKMYRSKYYGKKETHFTILKNQPHSKSLYREDLFPILCQWKSLPPAEFSSCSLFKSL